MLEAKLEASQASFAQADEEMKSAGQMHWGPVKADQCVRPGYRKYSSVLWDIPFGQSWEAACATMPITINGHYFAKPTRCVNAGAMWGEWEVPDSSCATANGYNAVIFLKHDIPINLGHVGWGFLMNNGEWCYGSTEIASAIAILPGQNNGVFIETGSKAKMFEAFRSGGNAPRPGWNYQVYKALQALTPNPAAGRGAAEMTKALGYLLAGNNCMDHAVRVVNTFAGIPVVPTPHQLAAHLWIPNLWFKQIVGVERSTSDPF